MTLEMVIIAIVRIAGSLPVLRWPLAGGIIAVVRILGAIPVLWSPFYGGVFALLVDQSDLFLMNLLHLGGVHDYQAFDKYLDQVYLGTFLLVALRWPDPERAVAAGLYAYRLAGFAAFELSGSRTLLLFFPNVFEFWFLLVAAIGHWRPSFVFTRGRVLGWGAVLLICKEFQEYAVHGARWFDGFTAVEAIEAVWGWLTSPLR